MWNFAVTWVKKLRVCVDTIFARTLFFFSKLLLLGGQVLHANWQAWFFFQVGHGRESCRLHANRGGRRIFCQRIDGTVSHRMTSGEDRRQRRNNWYFILENTVSVRHRWSLAINDMMVSSPAVRLLITIAVLLWSWCTVVDPTALLLVRPTPSGDSSSRCVRMEACSASIVLSNKNVTQLKSGIFSQTPVEKCVKIYIFIFSFFWTTVLGQQHVCHKKRCWQIFAKTIMSFFLPYRLFP